MSTQLHLVQRHNLLRNELDENLQRKYALELKINEQFQEIKRLEISLEKHLRTTGSVK